MSTDHPQLRTAALPSGVELEYIEHGAPAGAPVLLLHGYTDSWLSFAPLLLHLPPTLRAIVPSQRGHGGSSRPPSGYDQADFAADAVALLDTLDVRRAAVAGHSMGSFIAQRIAIEHPGRVSRLALVGSAPTCAGHAGVIELLEAVRGMRDPIDPAFVRAFQESTLGGPVAPGFLDRVVEESLKVPAFVWQAALEGLSTADHRDRLGSIRAPTALFWGDRDSLFSLSDQETLAAAIPQSRIFAYPGTGHALHWERPERFAEDLAAWVVAG
jgi:pimeloyl-ACP methyl ester carboxylesterase